MKNSSKATGKKRKGKRQKRQKIKSALTRVVQKESDYRQQKREDKKKSTTKETQRKENNNPGMIRENKPSSFQKETDKKRRRELASKRREVKDDTKEREKARYIHLQPVSLHGPERWGRTAGKTAVSSRAGHARGSRQSGWS